MRDRRNNPLMGIVPWNFCVRRDWYFQNCFRKVPVPSDNQTGLNRGVHSILTTNLLTTNLIARSENPFRRVKGNLASVDFYLSWMS
jgi:hypothetical protein